MAKPLQKIGMPISAVMNQWEKQGAFHQEIAFSPSKKGAVLLLARISDETARRADGDDQACEKCGLNSRIRPTPHVRTLATSARRLPFIAIRLIRRERPAEIGYIGR